MAGILLSAWLGTPARSADVPINVLSAWTTYNNYGWTNLRQGRYARAEEQFRMAIEEIRPYEKEAPRLMARSYADLARTLYLMGRHADAEPLARWALEVRDANGGVAHDAIFQNLYTLAMIHVAQGHFAQAEPLLKRALDLQETAMGRTHVQVAETLDDLAGVCAAEDKFEEAEGYYKRALLIWARFNPEVNVDLAACAERYARMLKRIGRTADAQALRELAAFIRRNLERNAERKRDSQPKPEYKSLR